MIDCSYLRLIEPSYIRIIDTMCQMHQHISKKRCSMMLASNMQDLSQKHKLLCQMTLASHKGHLVTCAEATGQVSDEPIIKLAQSETIKHDSQQCKRHVYHHRKCKKQKSEDMPWRNPWQAQCDSHMGVTCGLAQENVDSSAIQILV